MVDRTCVKRLQQEFKALCREPVSHVVAKPLPSDLLEWHYVLQGSEGTPFEGGFYHGKLKFPSDYPFKPPSISMITPNGRFATQKRLCMSMSDFHPETWDPMWSVSTILTGLLSFMMDNSPTTGSLNTSDEEKRRLARESLAFNCKNATFRKLFPELVHKFAEMQAEDPSARQESGRNNSRAEDKRAGTRKDVEQAELRPLHKFPGWLTAVIVAVLCSIMALPLLSSDLKLS